MFTYLSKANICTAAAADSIYIPINPIYLRPYGFSPLSTIPHPGIHYAERALGLLKKKISVHWYFGTLALWHTAPTDLL
jgi:hypothetical protein